MKVCNFMIKTNSEKIEKTHAHHDSLVLEAITKLGGKIQMRVMEFRKHLQEPLRESQIKQSLKRLMENGALEMTGEKNDSRGQAYRVLP